MVAWVPPGLRTICSKTGALPAIAILPSLTEGRAYTGSRQCPLIEWVLAVAVSLSMAPLGPADQFRHSRQPG